MARISSYPTDSTIQDKDSWIGTESTNRATRNFTAEDIANYVVTSTSVVTGSGTLNTIPMWTPDGSKLSDSIMTQVLLTPSTYALDVGSSRITETSVASTTISGTTVIATNITGVNAGIVSLSGGVIIGNESTDVLQITSSVSDSTGTGSTAAGQVLVSNAAGQLVWEDPSAAITKLVPYFQIATPGGSDTYTQSNNIVDFDWSGGSGTYEYILPSATAIPYRKIRFVNNSTVSANTKVHITAPGTETIDGGAFYEINKAYNGCAVWSDGVQWIVIQAKA